MPRRWASARELEGPAARAGRLCFLYSSELWAQCIYDNTLANPALADSLAEQRLTEPVDVHFGTETVDEMCTFMVGTLPYDGPPPE